VTDRNFLFVLCSWRVTFCLWEPMSSAFSEFNAAYNLVFLSAFAFAHPALAAVASLALVAGLLV
jgi:hypothetical protein